MKDTPLVIRITTGTLFMFFLLVFFAYLLYEVRDLVLIVISSIIFSLALAPGKRLLMKVRIPEPITVLFLYLFVFSILGFFLYFLFPIFIEQYRVFFASLPTIVDSIVALASGTVFENFFTAEQLRALLPFTDSSAALQQIAPLAGGGILSLFGGLVNVLLFLLLTFLFSVNPQSLDTFLQVVTARRYRAYVEDLWDRTRVKMGQWFQGQIVLIFVISALVYFSLLILGIPNALFLAVFAGAMEILPIFGPFLGAIPAVLMALTTGDPFLVVAVLIVFLVIQQLENTLIYPLVVSKVVGVSSVLIVLAMVVGASVAGFIGIVIAVPLAAVIQELFVDVQSGKLQKMCFEDKGK